VRGLVRRIAVLALAGCLCALVVSGCKKSDDDDDGFSGDSSSGDAGTFGTEEYPGTTVASGNVASDGLAMSISGEDFAGGLNFVHNGGRCQGIATYRVSSGQLYAHYWDGEEWTPPVALKAADAVAGTASTDVGVAFLNAQENSDDDASQRDGDALIFWRVNDVDDDGAGAADGVNSILYVTYFDVSASASAGSNFGFQEFATRVSSQDEAGEDVTAVAIVSDGLCGEARWSDAGSRYRWGDGATSVVVVWRQAENNDGAPGAEDNALYAVRFDPEEDLDETLPLTPSAEVRLVIDGMGASDTGTSSEETQVAPLLVAYNDLVFFVVAADNSTAGDDAATPFTADLAPSNDSDDQVIQYVRFDLAAGTAAAAVSLHPAGPSALDLIENHATFLQTDFDALHANAVFGADEGLAVTAIFHVCLVGDEDGDGTDPGDNARLVLSEIGPDGTLVAGAFVDAEDPDASDRVTADVCDTRMSRNGDYLWIAWLEVADAGASDDLAMWAAAYFTTRPDDDGAFTLPPLSASLTAAASLNADADGFDVEGYMFQDGLGYICGAQSDPDRMSLFYNHPDSAAEDVFRTVLAVDTASMAVAFTTDLFESFEPGDLVWSRVNSERADFNAVDAGFDGEVLAVYRQDVGGAAADDFRVVAERTGSGAGIVEIDSAVAFRQTTPVPGTPILLVGTPPGEEIGGFGDPERSHGFEIVHVLFRETESSETSGLGFALRTRAYVADADDALLDSFVPSASGADFQPPFDLDLTGVDPSAATDAEVVGVGVSGHTVGLWFTELGHLWYQQYSGGAEDGEIGWYDVDGASDPILVDDDSAKELNAFEGFYAKTCGCETLGCAVTFWSKSFDSGAGGSTVRLQARVRDD
jgi:hypothetical protein